MKKCKCGTEHERNHRYCQSCHNAYMRNWRKQTPLTQEQKVKDRARSHVSLSIKRGMISRGICSYCKTDKEIQAHHQDYSKPLLIVWLCKTHHHQVTIGELKDDFIPIDYSLRKNRLNYQEKYREQSIKVDDKQLINS